MKKQINSLYLYIQDHIDNKLVNFRIQHSVSDKHHAFFIPFPKLSQFNTNNWLFKEQHLTIEKNVIKDNVALSPYHYTLVLHHKDNSHRLCIIHYYLNEAFQFNGNAHQKIIEVVNGNAEALSVTPLSHLNAPIASDLPFSLNDLQQDIKYGIGKLHDLALMKSQELIEIEKNILEMDKVMGQYLENYAKLQQNKEFRAAAIAHLTTYIEAINRKNRYTDFTKDSSSVILRSIYSMLESMSEIAPTVTLHEDNFLDEPSNTHSKTIQQSPIKKVAPDSICSKELIEQLAREVLELQKETTDTSMMALEDKLNRLSIELITFEFKNSSLESKQFASSIRDRLPRNPFTPQILRDRVLEGDLSTVTTICEHHHFGMDYIDIFESLLNTIETNKNHTNMDALIDVAMYFYRTSELYRDYLLVRMQASWHKTWLISDEPVLMSKLGMLILYDHFKAFKMYLAQGINIDSYHLIHGRHAFNAVYMIVQSMGRSAFSPEPYLQLLFQYGATIQNPHLFLSETKFAFSERTSTRPNDVSKVLSQMMFAPEKNKRTIQKNSYLTDFDEINKTENILELAWKVYQQSKPEYIAQIVPFTDMKTCLFELLRMLDQGHFLVALVPSFDGGVFFHTTEKIKEAYINSSIKRMHQDSFTTLAINQKNGKVEGIYCKNITFGVHIVINSEFENQEVRLLALRSASHLYNHFSDLFLNLNDEEKRVFSKKMLSLAFQAQRDNLDSRTQARFYLGAIIAQSLLEGMDLKDYKTLFKLLEWYGKSTYAIASDPMVLQSIEQNAKYLVFNFLNLVALQLQIPQFEEQAPPAPRIV